MKNIQLGAQNSIVEKNTFSKRLKKDLIINRSVYLMFLPVLTYYLIFHYKPMYGAVIAFKDYVPSKGILGSDWIGFKNFIDFFSSFYFQRILKNTLVISFTSLIFGFPAPILLALLINELKNKFFSRTIQTITYMPHFISLVVVCGMIKSFTYDTGIINDIICAFGGERLNLLSQPKFFVPIYVISGIWQEIGWGSIIYLSAISSIDPELYEASKIDGAGRLKQTMHVTLPCIAPTIVVLLILRVGSILNVGFEKIILLYSPATYETADVISSFVYRKGLLEFNWGFSAAVGIFNQVINFILLISANMVSRKVNESSLW